ncbi:T6SS effector amidase Tae4 family protein [Pedobacter sp.]|uniref:T6SS effector amidase Tae4 family protein n=1 Tax=Pedobacter sp. TaxID=1411316 RepID=UPI003BA8965B
MLRGLAHGVAQGGISTLSGGNFLTGFATGSLGSLAGSGWQSLGEFAKSGVGTVAFSAVSGGIGAELTGGNFWQGAGTGAIVAGLNHLGHQVKNKFYDAKLKKMFDVYKKSVDDFPGASDFYDSIGGPLGDWAAQSPDMFENTCAARLSKALNYGGFEIPKGTPATYLGGDGKSYFINAKAMSNYLSKSTVWGTPRSLSNYLHLKNAVFYQSDFGGGVSGHLDILYRGVPAHHIYPNPTKYWH